ncbi:MAG: hypothetical protein R6X19_03365 [Kiritimatiellia bacterium]
MLISLGGTTLCDGPTRAVDKSGGPADLAVNGRILTQPVFPIRATASTVLWRANLATTVTFRVTRLFSTVAAAEMWAVAHPGSVVRAGTLTITEGATSKTMVNANLEDVQCRHVGASVIVTYKIIGGVLS